MKQEYNVYSIKTKKAIIRAKNAKLFPELGIPKSTAYHWIKNGVKEPKPLVIVSSQKAKSSISAENNTDKKR